MNIPPTRTPKLPGGAFLQKPEFGPERPERSFILVAFWFSDQNAFTRMHVLVGAFWSATDQNARSGQRSGLHSGFLWGVA